MKSRVVILSAVFLLFGILNAQTSFVNSSNFAPKGEDKVKFERYEILEQMELVNHKIRKTPELSGEKMEHLNELKQLVFEYEKIKRKESRESLKSN